MTSYDDEHACLPFCLVDLCLVQTLFYMAVACLSYSGFGDSSPGNLLTGFGFFDPYCRLHLCSCKSTLLCFFKCCNMSSDNSWTAYLITPSCEGEAHADSLVSSIQSARLSIESPGFHKSGLSALCHCYAVESFAITLKESIIIYHENLIMLHLQGLCLPPMCLFLFTLLEGIRSSCKGPKPVLFSKRKS